MFDRLSVLLIEDTLFVRNMLIDVLRALKVGKIQACSNGIDAINLLRDVTRMRGTALDNTLGFDLVICDYLMSPISGSMILRWVRSHENSPDRFLPFIVLSGIAERDTVREMRELGATEFLAKPFSVSSIASHLLAVIETPRPFIYTKTFFGPDRRRQQRPTLSEKRVISANEIEAIYVQKKPSSLEKSSKKKVFIFHFPNRLKEKVFGGKKENDKPVRLDPNLLKEAQKQLDHLEGDYVDWVRGSVEKLNHLHTQAMEETNTKARVSIAIHIAEIANDLRGQGSIFGYPLITLFGKSLYECAAENEEIKDDLLEFIRVHVDGINAVTREKIKGRGGDMGDSLVQGLEQAREKLAGVPPAPVAATPQPNP